MPWIELTLFNNNESAAPQTVFINTDNYLEIRHHEQRNRHVATEGPCTRLVAANHHTDVTQTPQDIIDRIAMPK